jgi:hypothetical protein
MISFAGFKVYLNSRSFKFNKGSSKNQFLLERRPNALFFIPVKFPPNLIFLLRQPAKQNLQRH